MSVGWDADTVAYNYKFGSLENMIQHEQLSDIVELDQIYVNEQPVMIYKGKPHPAVEHITRQLSITEKDVRAK